MPGGKFSTGKRGECKTDTSKKRWQPRSLAQENGECKTLFACPVKVAGSLAQENGGSVKPGPYFMSFCRSQSLLGESPIAPTPETLSPSSAETLSFPSAAWECVPPSAAWQTSPPPPLQVVARGERPVALVILVHRVSDADKEFGDECDDSGGEGDESAEDESVGCAVVGADFGHFGAKFGAERDDGGVDGGDGGVQVIARGEGFVPLVIFVGGDELRFRLRLAFGAVVFHAAFAELVRRLNGGGAHGVRRR